MSLTIEPPPVEIPVASGRDGFYQLTYWSHPTEIIQTQWGSLKVMDWLVLECERVRSRYPEAHIREHPEGWMALFVEESRMSFEV